MANVDVQQTQADGSRWYHWPSQDRSVLQKFWSVTTIIDRGIPKSALKWWAARTTAEWCVDNVKTIQTMLEAPVVESFDPVPWDALERLRREDDTVDAEKLALLVELARHRAADPLQLYAAREEAIETAKGAHRRITRRAALRGSHVHAAIEAYALGKPYPGVPDEVMGQYREAIRFLEEHRPVVEQVEAKVFNRERHYAGTLDSIMLFPTLARNLEDAGLFTPTDEQPWPRLIVDYKTSGGVYAEVGLQESAYARAEFQAGPDGLEYPMPKIDAALVVHLPFDAEYELRPVSIGDEVWRVFLNAYEVLRWFEEIEGTVLGRPVPRPILADPAAEFGRLRERPREELLIFLGSERFRTVRPALEAMGADELALAIVWDRQTGPDVERYRPERPCPNCGWEVEPVKNRNKHSPRWQCTNRDGCRARKDKKDREWPWASWHEHPEEFGGHPRGQTSHLKPIIPDDPPREPEPEPRGNPATGGGDAVKQEELAVAGGDEGGSDDG